MKRIKTRYIVISIIFSVILYTYYHVSYSFPWTNDFSKNGDRYMEIINLLNTDDYRDVISLWWKMKCLQLVTSDSNYCKENIKYSQKYIDLMDKVSKIDSTYFDVCPNGIIKISKGSYLNDLPRVVYVYSKNGFAKLPSRMKEKINDHMITYHNYDSTYSASNSCNVK